MYIVFVGFPESGVDGVISAEFHGQYLQVMDDWITRQSYGKLTVSDFPNSKILLPPGYTMPSSGTVPTWEASAPVQAYQNGDMNDLPPTYPAEYRTFLENNNWGSMIASEILYKIWLAYEQDYPNGGLFPAAGGNSTNGCELHLIYLMDPTNPINPFPESGGGGSPGPGVTPATIPSALAPFYQNIHIEDGVYSGAKVEAPSYPLSIYHPHTYIRAWIHEFVHTLGPGDGPPALQGENLSEWQKYFYGNLNVICQHLPSGNEYPIGHPQYGELVPFRGTPPLADPWLAMLPWNTGSDPGSPVVVDFTDTSYRDQVIEDVASGGQFYKYVLSDENDPTEEYFLIAYHGGSGLDVQPEYVENPDEPMVPSKGLAIWHCRGKGMFDLESAHGLFRYDQANYTPTLQKLPLKLPLVVQP